MRTRCPNCATLYDIQAEELEITNGLASCYSCKRAFNAWDNETEDEEPGLTPRLAIEPSSTKASPPPPAKEKPAILPAEPPVQPEKKSPPASSEPARSKAIKQPYLPKTKIEVPEGLAPILPTALGEDPLSATQPKKTSIMRRLLQVFGLLLLLVLASAQLAWLYRDKLLANPQILTIATRACTYLNCEPPVQRAVEKFAIVQRSLQPDRGSKNSLRLSVSIRNDAAFQQILPDLQLTLTDYKNQPIVRRLFTPEQYQSTTKILAPQAITEISLLIEDPGWQASGFELEFF